MVPTDPSSMAQALVVTAAKIPGQGCLPGGVGEELLLYVWCVSGWPLRSSGREWAGPALGLCLEMESFSSSLTPSPVC